MNTYQKTAHEFHEQFMSHWESKGCFHNKCITLLDLCDETLQKMKDQVLEKGFEKIQGFPLQDLIGLIENQVTEESLLIKALEPLIAFSPEILLLGSTHYPYLETLLVKLFPFSKIVNPSSQFALEISANVLSPSKNDLDEDLFITTKYDPGFLRRLQKNPINNLLKKDVKRV